MYLSVIQLHVKFRLHFSLNSSLADCLELAFSITVVVFHCVLLCVVKR